MTSPEWEAANEDDSDRFPQTSHASASEWTESHELGSQVVPDPARVARYAEALWGCVGPHVKPEDRDDEGLGRVVAAVVAVADEEHAALVADMDMNWRRWKEAEAEVERLRVLDKGRLADVQDEYRKAAESWDRTRARLNEEIERRRVWIDRAEAAEAEVERMRAILDDASGRFRESDHLIPKWAKDLRAAERRVVQLRGDVTSWQGMHREVSRRARAAEAKVAKVEELADEWKRDKHRVLDDEQDPQRRGWRRAVEDCEADLRAVLADAPAEQRAEGGA